MRAITDTQIRVIAALVALVVTPSVSFAASALTEAKPSPRVAVRATGAMVLPRAAHSAALLSSGRVLIAGGCTLPGCDDVEGQTATAELYDPTTRHFRMTGRMNRIRISAIAISLPNGDVVIAGGYSGTEPTDAVEIYDGRTRSFRDAEPMLTPRADGTATRLRDGRILFAGGDDGTSVLKSAEIYDPASGRFSATGSMKSPRKIHSATLLTNGRVLLAGGATVGGEVIKTAELFDPKTETFTTTGSLAKIRYKHGAVRLVDGRVLVIGGAPAFDLGLRYRQTELYDPRRGRFVAGPPLARGRYHLVDAVLTLPGGRVLVAGDSPMIEVYEPKQARFSVDGRLGLELGFSTAVRLRDGTVLIAGGYTSVGERPVKRAWTYQPR